MAVEFNSRLENGILVIRARGSDDNLEDVVSYGLALMNTARSVGTQRLLVDETAVEYRVGFQEVFEACEYFSTVLKQGAMIAFVARPDQARILKFMSTVAFNRGIEMHVFHREHDARAWLGRGMVQAAAG